LKEKENSLWKEQALSVLTPIVHASSMIPCAEDLGVNLAVMPEVLKQLEILSLKVVRWNSLWEEDGQPYYPLEKYPELSVATTSVHDSSTVRQWWQDEKQSVQAFIKAVNPSEDEAVDPDKPFDEKAAAFVMENSAKCGSALFINPLQDYLYLQQKYFLEDAQSERINVPGSVNAFNWTYRMPVSVEALLQDEEFIQRVQKVVKIHDGK
ncbi:MAG: 4-alpha-glucanotransferase, partial [Treponema sp.]|nr:4-alpha-glucanotransferase [Treponema sp.]